ncbi:VPS26B isoform 4, partial [Pan troglodytes]
AEHKTEDGKKEKYFLFYDGETVSGKVSLALKNPNKRLEHQGIKIEFIGQIAISFELPSAAASMMLSKRWTL